MRRHHSLPALLLLVALPACTGVLSVEDPAIGPSSDAGPGADAEIGGDAGPIRPRQDAGPVPPGVDAGPPPPGVDAGPLTPDAGPIDPCANVTCQTNAVCEQGECDCSEGFIAQGPVCVAPPPGDPVLRTSAEVCAEWQAGHVQNASPEWVAGSGCGAGTMTPDGIADTLRRVNLFRWLAGLGPVTHDASNHEDYMECANMMSRNSALDHSPPSNWTCYTAAGAGAAGRSNISFGYRSSPASIDGYMRDRNTMSLGHRRWILGARLGAVQIGAAHNRGVSGSREGYCLGVFSGGGSTDREWTAYPNQGYAPLATAENTWSFHFNSIQLRSDTDVEMERLDGSPLQVSTYRIGGGSGPPATIAWDPVGWTPEAGQSYRVTITGTSAGDVTYEVRLLDC